ncbi:hypothetical protein MHB50_12725 [Siminovitchia sp. FSL H7-0308]|uniref:Uncharacterized protein n=1 Tax=Siminovitchia thermophila TaxID=1245522 RepID=A0ABS2RD23_9BACI|nr:hypothetical protein [Siminovitchia thermophila]MBM7717094.1 hypothetical protein [Siminovitchia thermophila]
MQLGVLIGLSILLGVIAVFLIYFLGGALDSEDSKKIDELPSDQQKSG